MGRDSAITLACIIYRAEQLSWPRFAAVARERGQYVGVSYHSLCRINPYAARRGPLYPLLLLATRERLTHTQHIYTVANLKELHNTF